MDVPPLRSFRSNLLDVFSNQPNGSSACVQAEVVFSPRQIRLWSLLLMQAVPAEGPRWSAMRSAPPGAGLLHLQPFLLR